MTKLIGFNLVIYGFVFLLSCRMHLDNHFKSIKEAILYTLLFMLVGTLISSGIYLFIRA